MTEQGREGIGASFLPARGGAGRERKWGFSQRRGLRRHQKKTVVAEKASILGILARR